MSIVDWGAGEGFTVYPQGTYKVEIIKWKKDEAKSGTGVLRISARIMDGEHVGGSITTSLSLHDNSLWRVPIFVSNCNLDISRVIPSEVMSSSFQRLFNTCIGRSMFWNVEEEMGQDGNIRNHVKSFAGNPNMAVLVLDENAYQSFLEPNDVPSVNTDVPSVNPDDGLVCQGPSDSDVPF